MAAVSSPIMDGQVIYEVNNQSNTFSLGTALNQGSTTVFRKTLSQIGGRVGTRQPEGFMNG